MENRVGHTTSFLAMELLVIVSVGRVSLRVKTLVSHLCCSKRPPSKDIRAAQICFEDFFFLKKIGHKVGRLCFRKHVFKRHFHGLNENCLSQVPIVHLVSFAGTVGRIRRFSLAAGSTSLRVGFKVKKHHLFPVCSLCFKLTVQGVSFKGHGGYMFFLGLTILKALILCDCAYHTTSTILGLWFFIGARV